MKNTYILIRHAEPKKEPDKHPTKWILSKKGKKEAENLCEILDNKIDLLYSSEEIKAQETIKPLSNKLNLEINLSSFFNEQKRGSKYLTKEEFMSLKKKKLENQNYNPDNGESSEQSLRRFKEGINNLDKKYNNKTIIIASHGTVLSLYFANLLDKESEIFERWNHMDFCAYGIVKQNKVIKDIIS